MTSEKLSATTATTENKVTREDTVPTLLKFDDSNSVTTGKDINNKITSLDNDLVHLRSELGAINSSVEEGLDRLGDTDTDLTAKVSETYKRLGEIDNSYKSLLEISTRIDNDIQRLNGDVSTVAEQSATGIKTLEQSTLTQSNKFAEKNQQVVTRVNHLVETSKLSGELLSQKIKMTTEKMLQMEKQVVSEIEDLSSVVSNKTKAIEVSVESNKARILKLQSVDEAIIKRATTLEISAAELAVKSQDIQASVELLQHSSNNLSSAVESLKQRTRALEDVTKNQGSLISSLQKAGSELGDKLALLSGRESKHFSMVTAGFLMLLIVTAVLYFSQQSQYELAEAKTAQRSDVVDFSIVRLQQSQDRAVAIAATTANNRFTF